MTIAPVTTRIRGLPVEVELGPEDGLPHLSAVNLDDITTVRKSQLGRPITTLSDDKMVAVAQAIKFALDLD